MQNQRAFLVYLATGGISTLANSIMFTVLAVYYVKTIGLNPFELVLVGTAVELTVFVFEVPTGVVADTFSRRLSVIIGIFLTGLAFLVQGLFPSFAVVMLAQLLWGIGDTFISGANDAWIADEVGEENVGQVFLRNTQVGQVAGLAGVIISVTLASVWLALPVIVGGCLYLALGLFLIAAMPEHFRPSEHRGEQGTFQAMGHTLKGGVKLVRGRPVLLTILGIGFFLGAASEGFDRLWEANFLLNFAFPSLGNLDPVVWFGIINAGSGILGLITAEIYRRRASQENSLATIRTLLVANGVAVVSIIAFGLAGNFWMALAAIWVKAIAGTVAGPVYRTWLTLNITPEVRATVLSMSSQVNAIGQVAGGPGVGAIGSLISVRAAIVTVGLLQLPAQFLYGSALRRRKAEEVSLETEGVIGESN